MMHKLFWLYKALATVLGSLFGTLYLKMWGCRLARSVRPQKRMTGQRLNPRLPESA